jgi:hypothetical protein
MAAVAGPLCTWLVAAYLSAACNANEHKPKHCCSAGRNGVMFDQCRCPRARRRGAARSGETTRIHPLHCIMSFVRFAGSLDDRVRESECNFRASVVSPGVNVLVLLLPCSSMGVRRHVVRALCVMPMMNCSRIVLGILVNSEL